MLSSEVFVALGKFMIAGVFTDGFVASQKVFLVAVLNAQAALVSSTDDRGVTVRRRVFWKLAQTALNDGLFGPPLEIIGVIHAGFVIHLFFLVFTDKLNIMV